MVLHQKTWLLVWADFGGIFVQLNFCWGDLCNVHIPSFVFSWFYSVIFFCKTIKMRKIFKLLKYCIILFSVTLLEKIFWQLRRDEWNDTSRTSFFSPLTSITSYSQPLHRVTVMYVCHILMYRVIFPNFRDNIMTR